MLRPLLQVSLRQTHPAPAEIGLGLTLVVAVSAGTSSCQYTAEVVTSGEFTLPPAHAHAQTQPGIMGLSSSVKFDVLPRE